MNVTEITTAAGWIAGLAIVALIATGWRKPARAGTEVARAWPRNDRPNIKVVAKKTPLLAPTPFWKRVWAVVAGGALAFWMAAIAATLIAFGLAALVVTLTDMLKQ
ncbi:MAG: hypothetical protein HY826_11910 [Actinobacteria bacterium]|nr:hypothetical protein [Actinomycetota bacterium]